MKIVAQEVKFDDLVWDGDQNHCQLIIKYDTGAIVVENITAAEAAKLQAKIRF